MAKVIFTADTLLSIVSQVFQDDDLDTIVKSDFEGWNDKKVSEILNVDYYAYNHKAPSTSSIRDKLIAQDGKLAQIGMLDVLKRSFCLVSLNGIERLFSKDIDQIAVNGTLEYWLQAEKIKLLEALIEAANISLCGVKLPVIIQGESRKASLFFEMEEPSIEGQTEIGESAILPVRVTLMLSPNSADYSDWSVDVLMQVEDGEEEYVHLPVSSVQINNSMTSKGIPLARDVSKTNTINLSNSTVLTIAFDGYSDSEVIDMFANDMLERVDIDSQNKQSNNKVYKFRLSRKDKIYYCNFKLKDYQLIVKNDTEPESHVVTLTTGG